MTKAELREKLKSGDALDEAIGFTEMDCDHWIFKERSFRTGDEILYVPDLTMDCIATDAILESDDEIDRNPNNYLTGKTARRVIKTEANNGTPETPPASDETTAK